MKRSTFFSTLFIALLTALSASDSLAGKPDGKGGGKGGGGGEDDPPAAGPVEYEVHILGPGTATAINEFGVVVGRNVTTGGSVVVPGSLNGVRAIRYTPTAGGPIVEDLNEIPNASWEDLDQPGFPASDWIAVSAGDVNEWGQIVGAAENTSTLETGIFLFDPENSKFVIMPGDGPGPIYAHGRGRAYINNYGVIAAPNVNGDAITIYNPPYEFSTESPNSEVLNFEYGRLNDLNDAGWLVGRTTAGDGFQIEPDAGVYGGRINVHPIIAGCFLAAINDASPASICGTKRDGNNWKSRGPFKTLAGGTFADADWFYPANSTSAKDVNDHGDVVRNGGQGHLYYEGQSPGSGTNFAIVDLIAPEDASLWAYYSQAGPQAVTNRDSVTGFPSICYSMRTDLGVQDYVVAILIPRLPQ